MNKKKFNINRIFQSNEKLRIFNFKEISPGKKILNKKLNLSD
jgi:hypothetical protein